jgi:hypothetical protein
MADDDAIGEILSELDREDATVNAAKLNKRKGSPNEVHTPNGDFEGFIEKAYTCKKCGTPATGFFGFHKLWETDWYEKKLIERWVCQTCYEAFLACARDKCHKMLQCPKLTDPSISQVNSPAEDITCLDDTQAGEPQAPFKCHKIEQSPNLCGPQLAQWLGPPDNETAKNITAQAQAEESQAPFQAEESQASLDDTQAEESQAPF